MNGSGSDPDQERIQFSVALAILMRLRLFEWISGDELCPAFEKFDRGIADMTGSWRSLERNANIAIPLRSIPETYADTAAVLRDELYPGAFQSQPDRLQIRGC